MRIWVMSLLVAGAAFAGGDGVSSRASKGKKPFLSPAEIFQRLEKSPITFDIKGIEQLADVPRGKLAEAMWRELVPPLDYPKVTRSKSGITVAPWPVQKATGPEHQKAEQAYQTKDFEGAAEHYRAALKIDPRDYVARAYLGDTYLFGTKDPAAALENYEAAIALNPDDYRLYFFRANAHRHLEHKAESLADLRRSLVLKPRNSILIGAVQRSGGSMGRIEPDVLVLRSFARAEGGDFTIYADVERAEWLAWASCKAMWLADEAHRVEMTGDKKHGWSTIEEIECLASLIAVYERGLETKEGMRDDRLDRLVAIAKDGLIAALVVYEIGSRVDPQIVLKLDDSFRKLVERYVEKYVLTAPE